MEGLNGHFCHGFYPQVRPKSLILYFNVVSDETFQAENKRRSHEKDLRFFVPQKVFEWLSQKDKLKTIDFEEGLDFSMDVIENPFHCEVHCAD